MSNGPPTPSASPASTPACGKVDSSISRAFGGTVMIFAWLREFEFYLPLAALVLLLMWVIRRAKRWRKWLKITVRIFATFILVPSSLLLLLLTGCIFLGKSRSRMIYSPDRKHAIQLDTYDEGATGGSTNAELYSRLGLQDSVVFSGDWQSVNSDDIEWKGNSAVVIHYYQDEPLQKCLSTQGVTVTCAPGTDPYHKKNP